MSQNDMTIANAAGATVRADINSALQALVGLNSGSSAPSTTFAYMLWADTANAVLKQRNAANSGWAEIADLASGTFTPRIGVKGGDIASASNVTVPGGGFYFDVTGATAIAGMTVAAGRLFTLQFDGALTLTHGGSLNLPGGQNITTAAGDEFTFYATAANTVRCIGVASASGVAAKALTTQGDILYRSASGLARLGPGTSGQVLRTQGAGANPQWADAGGGAYAQVVSVNDGTVGSTASTSFVTTGISAAITPASTSNDVEVHVDIGLGVADIGLVAVTVFRGATDLTPAGDNGLAFMASAGGNSTSNQDMLQSVSFTFTDSPATTSATTYTVYIKDATQSTGRTVYFNQSPDGNRTGSANIVLREVSA